MSRCLISFIFTKTQNRPEKNCIFFVGISRTVCKREISSPIPFSWGTCNEMEHLQLMKNHSSSSSNHAKSACLACSNKWYHSLRDSNSVKTWLVHVLSSSDLHFEELLTHNNIPLTLLWQSTPIENPQHVWCYESLEARQAAREVVWQATQEQWQEIVARTVPLIRWLWQRLQWQESHFFIFCQENEQQDTGASAHQHHQVNQCRNARLMTSIQHSSDRLINVIE